MRGAGFHDRYRGFHQSLSENTKVDTLKHAKALSLLRAVMAYMCSFLEIRKTNV
jgi:hypothetical protein